MLEKLENGDELVEEPDTVDIEREQTIANYRTAIVILSVVAAASLIGLIILAIVSLS